MRWLSFCAPAPPARHAASDFRRPVVPLPAHPWGASTVTPRTSCPPHTTLGIPAGRWFRCQPTHEGLNVVTPPMSCTPHTTLGNSCEPVVPLLAHARGPQHALMGRT